MVDIIPGKAPSTTVYFPKDITMFRAYVYSLVCGSNGKTISREEFLAGCNRYGIDNPCPIITKRLSYYGNSEELDKEFKDLIEQYKDLMPAGINMDPD
jgi:hypothetical protein